MKNTFWRLLWIVWLRKHKISRARGFYGHRRQCYRRPIHSKTLPVILMYVASSKRKPRGEMTGRGAVKND
jgi:hypothetical protein